jgi:hypothetical protein
MADHQRDGIIAQPVANMADHVGVEAAECGVEVGPPRRVAPSSSG